MLLTADTDSLYSFEMHYGAEYVFADLLSLRLGVQERKGLNTIRQLTAGAGLRLSFITGAALPVFVLEHPRNPARNKVRMNTSNPKVALLRNLM